MRDVVKTYVGLTKPRIIELLLITTVPVMFLAAGGVPALASSPPPWSAASSPSGSANTINCVLGRDIDEQMRRPGAGRCRGTRSARARRRSSASSSVSWPRSSSEFVVNWLSSGLALAANLFYVFGYTMVLKRRTVQNIVWGGIAGCFPT